MAIPPSRKCLLRDMKRDNHVGLTRFKNMTSSLITVWLLKEERERKALYQRFLIYFYLFYFEHYKKSVVQQVYETLATTKKANGDSVFVFWDKQCLNYGQNWEAGFLNGLRNATVIVLLISMKVCNF